MSKKNDLRFKISTGLKNLLGKDLITDEFIAVFELVKNSYDAHSKDVYIVFEKIGTPNAKIKIIDKGKGMNYQDLIDKWLFVGYSAKREGTEDKKLDYRNNIKSKRFYAGAKGVGRFSCDRLGEKLTLYSIKEEKNSSVEQIDVNWKDFEKDSKIVFEAIPIKRKTISQLPSDYKTYKISNGTILEISALRDTWDRKKILSLKTSLAKLILPKFDESEKDNSFNIFVESEEELESDNKYKKECKKEKRRIDPKKIVNGPVENFIFETLNLKTTQISSEISEDGKSIVTKLIDRGKFIYELEEENEEYPLLENISVLIYFLNRSAKWNFTNKMNTEPVNYGNLFMYKNGFRIHPYGNPRDDSYGFDARRAQGYSRYLGTREIIGKIEIKGENPALKETTSRDGGLIKNASFEQLQIFLKRVLVRLEKYVVDAKKWGVDDEELKDFDTVKSEVGIVKLLANLSNDKHVKSIKYNDKIADILNLHEERSVKKLIRNFKKIAQKSNDIELEKKAIELEQKTKALQKAKNEAEKETEKERKKYKKKHDALKKTNKYLLAISKDLSPEAAGLIHHIGYKLSQTTPLINSLIKKVSKDSFNKADVLKVLSKIKLNTDQVEKISRLVIHSNFNLMVSEEKGDLIAYIAEYLSLYEDINETSSLKIKIERNTKEFQFLFSKINVSLILDNLISNAKKAKARNAKIIFSNGPKKSLHMIFADDGDGVNKEIEDLIFELGITSTTGSGVGLYTNKKLMKEMGGDFTYLGNSVHLKGASFELIF